VTSKAYSIIGWVTWKVVSRAVKRDLAANRSKLAAAAVVVGVLLAGIALAGDDDSQ
jgi:hypothetical protein